MSISKGFQVTISKKLSYILRHCAAKDGLKISQDGYVLLSDILNHPTVKKVKATEKDIEYVVKNNDKQRFQIKSEFDEKNSIMIKYIRATQDFAPYLPGSVDVISGMRKSCDIAIEINMNKAIADGVQFYVSQNNVILTEGVDKQGILPPTYFSKITDLKQDTIIAESPIQYIMVLDFQANCTDDPVKFPLKFNEIIQFPVVVVDVKALKICDKFHFYIKPTIEPKLTPFCIKLTSITQQKVDNGISIEQAILSLHSFLIQKNYLNSHFTFLTCGDYDLNGQMKREAQAKNYPVPNYLRKYINLKKVFPAHKYNQKAKQIHYIKQSQIKKAQVSGMEQMLELMKLKLQGTHHSGIDDAMNLARIVIKLVKDGKVFGQKDIHCSNYQTSSDYSRFQLKQPLDINYGHGGQEEEKKQGELIVNNVQQEKQIVDSQPTYSKDPCELSFYKYNYKDDGQNNDQQQNPIKIEIILTKLDKALTRVSQFTTFVIPDKLSKKALNIISLERIQEEQISKNMDQAIDRLKAFLGKQGALGRRCLLVSNQYDVMTLLQSEKGKPPKLLTSFFDLRDSIRCQMNRNSFIVNQAFYYPQSLYQSKVSIVSVLERSMKMKVDQIISNDEDITLAKVQLQLVRFIIQNKLHTVIKFMKSV